MKWLSYGGIAIAALALGYGLGRSNEDMTALAPPTHAADMARVPMPAGCDRPAYLVVSIDNLDRTKSAAYGEALRRTQIVPRHGGQYVAVGSEPVVLEGEWPKGRSFVLEKYPCMEMIKKFWYAEEYQQQIMPLRAGSGIYTVVAFEEFRPQVR